jgi:superfamily II DNA or RNA helicase
MRVTQFSEPGKRALLAFCRDLAQFGYVRVARGKFEYRMVKIFGGRTSDHLEYYLHRNQEHDFRIHLSSYGFTDNNVLWVEHPMYEPVKCEFPIKDTRTPREEQIPYIQYLIDPGKIKVITIQTGRGKTFLSLKAIAAIGQRTMMVIKGMYVDKWISDVREMFDIAIDDLMVVRGSAHLMKLIELAQKGELTAKYIICTNKTIYNYIQSYEKFKDEDVGYGVHPLALYETLGVGVRLIDEVHQDFHLNFRQDIYTHVPKTISLSATLDSDDKKLNQMYEVMFPSGIRPPALAHKKYIAMRGLVYAFRQPKLIRYKNAMKQYSHVIFEQSVMKNQHVLNSYLQMVLQIVRHSYIRVRQPGQRCLVYFATVEMCGMFQRLVKMFHPELVVNRYTSDDEYEALLTADIACTTLQSAGTAVDIPGLRIVVMTTALSSKQANEQALGRLRELKDWPDTTPEFFFLICRDIEKHGQYAQAKSEKLGDKVLSYNVHQTQFHIG